MPREEIFEEPWYRCLRCGSIFKLKHLIVRHLISHKVHRFETDSDTKGAEDWDRVRVGGGTVLKVDIPKEPLSHPSVVESHQQTSWILEREPQHPNTLTIITVNNGADNNLSGGSSTSIAGYNLGPFDPIISQTFLKFEVSTNDGGTMITLPNSTTSGVGIDFPATVDDFKCRYCSAPFAHSRSRSVHEAKVHNEEMIDGYACQLCSKNFSTIASVQDHYRCTHKITPPVKKAWKLWKTHGGNLNDYIQQQVVLSVPLEQDDEAPIQTISLDPAAVSSLSLGLDVTVESSHDLQQQEFESYYFHTEAGPMPMTVTTTSNHPNNNSNNMISSTSQHNIEENSFLNITKKRRKGGRNKSKDLSSAPSSPKKRNNKKVIPTTIKSKKVNNSLKSTQSLPTSTESLSSKSLPKDSPFRYQRLKCLKCEGRFRTQWELTLHLGQIHAEFSCEFCSLVFLSKVEMVRHQYTTHNTELGYYTCRSCRKNFGSPRIVQEHVHYSHPGAKVPSTSVALKWRRA